MPTEKEEIVQQVSVWSPEQITELVGELAWPIVVLILGWKLRGNITSAISSFLNTNDVTEVSASATGITAKFKAAQQKAEISEESNSSNTVLPIGGDYDSVTEIHNQQTTEFSNELHESIKAHINALDVSDTDTIELLTKEASILQAAVRFNNINQVLFRSQFDLFSLMPTDGNTISDQELQKYFDNVVSSNFTEIEEWDLVKYLSYPASIGIIEYHNDGYRLTTFGKSYVQYMKKNLGLIDSLGKL